VRQDGNQSERVRTALARIPSCTFRDGKIRDGQFRDGKLGDGERVPEKALTIAGADRFSRRGGACRLHALLVNQLRLNLGVAGGIVKEASRPQAEYMCSIKLPAHMPAPTGAARPPRRSASPQGRPIARLACERVSIHAAVTMEIGTVGDGGRLILRFILPLAAAPELAIPEP
jgi:hypothetical protein